MATMQSYDATLTAAKQHADDKLQRLFDDITRWMKETGGKLELDVNGGHVTSYDLDGDPILSAPAHVVAAHLEKAGHRVAFGSRKTLLFFTRRTLRINMD